MSDKSICVECRKEYVYVKGLCRACYTRERRKKRIGQGLCINCANPNNGKTIRCDDCNAKMGIRNKRRYEKHLKDGLCWCGKKVKISGVCKKCYNRTKKRQLKMQKQRRHQWKEQGLCSFCGREREDKCYLMCEKCREYHRIRGRDFLLKQIITKYCVDENVAKQIRNMRIELGCMTKKQMQGLVEEMKKEEGYEFTEMVMDGIPDRKGIKFRKTGDQ